MLYDAKPQASVKQEAISVKNNFIYLTSKLMTSHSSHYTGNIAWKAQSEDSNEKQDGTRADFLLQHTRYWMNEWCIYIALYVLLYCMHIYLVCLAVKGGLFPSLEPVCLVLVQDSGYTWLGNHNSFRNPWILLVVKCQNTKKSTKSATLVWIYFGTFVSFIHQ